MGGRRKLDITGLAPRGIPLTRFIVVLVVLLAFSSFIFGQSAAPDSQIEQIKQLAAAERWQEVVRTAEKISTPPAEINFYYGTALAHLDRWDDARRALEAGSKLQPKDERFYLELAGVAFKQKRYGEATKHLGRALRLVPDDSYANDFLGTIYFLQGNLDAAVKHWNRSNRPQIVNILSDPTPRLNSVLLDRTFKFSPSSTLRLADLQITEKRLRGLEIFPVYHLDLRAREDDMFDVVFRNRELNGWGANKWEALLLLLRGLPAQSVYPEFFNWKGRAINFTSMFRWDAEKRRVRAGVSSPFFGNPARHWAVGVDLREENWNLRQSFTGAAPSLGFLNLRREALHAKITSFVSGRWDWSAGGEFSHRDFRDVVPGLTLTPALLTKGYQLKQVADLHVDLLRIPERRFLLAAGISSQAGRLWSSSSHSFEKLQGSLGIHWFPQAQGDDYELQHQIRVGKTWGSTPFDELYTLGISADNDLWMRGHIATRDGQKGSAPLGRSYFLSNWEADKNIYRHPFFTVKLGPFVDTGKMIEAASNFGSPRWLWDVGLQAKFRLLGAEAVFSYGKDLRSGNNAFYVMLR